MVAYTDKIVGKITNKLKELDLYENTIIIFTGDNGTHPSIYTPTPNGFIQGGKGNTIDAGTHVPLIVSWPEKIKKPAVVNELVEFSDFFPTLASIVASNIQTDGKSFYPLLTDSTYDYRKTAFVHYDPKWGKRVNQYRNQFVRTIDYKLYQNGKFFNLNNDKLEKNPLTNDGLSEKELMIKSMLEKELKKHPVWK